MILQLSHTYPNIHGTPAISKVDTAIFTEKYFTYCLQCTFCHDSCCYYGVDVDTENLKRIHHQTTDLEIHLGTSRETWFHEQREACEECPGEETVRTKNEEDRCVFLNKETRGCGIHGFCHERGVDYHILKPMVCSLFPLTFENDVLHPADEVTDRTLICLGQGETLYNGVRDELKHYWGVEFVNELDGLQNKFDGNGHHS
jgi:Fe-S-cluster containining protein